MPASTRDPLTGLTAAEEAAYGLEVAELGQRVTDWLTDYQFAALYSSERDRTWAEILMMVRSVQFHTSGSIPAAWMPRFSPDGNWEPGTWVPRWK